MIFSTLSGGRHIKSHVRVTVSGNELEVYVEPEDNVISNIDIESIMNSIYIRHLNFMPRNRIVWFFCNKKIPVSITKNGRFVVSDGIREIPAKGFTIKGFTIMEVVVALTIAGILMTGISMLMKSMMNYKSLTDSLQRIKKIEQAIEVTYRENIRYVEGNCYGWTDSVCTNLTVMPLPHAGDSTKLLLYTYLDTVVRAWDTGAGCTVTGAVPNFEVRCPDGYGQYFTFTGFANTHSLNTHYQSGYNRTPYRVTITSQSNPDITDTWSSGYLDSEYLSYSQKKLLTLMDAIKSYHLARLTHEATVNTCDSTNGGLASHDDVIIPWVWQALGNSPSQECSGIESGICGCSSLNNASIWPTSATYAVVDTDTEFSALLGNIGLNNIYRTDGFGNALTYRVVVNSALTGQVPPRPQVNYTWAVKPPYRGIIGVYDGVNWISNWRVVYAQ